MTRDQTLVLGILVVAMVLFVRGRWRHDVVAFASLMIAVVVGVVPAAGCLSGFGHPAVFTVAAVLVVSRALQSSGALDPVAERLARLEDRPTLQLAALTALATGLSAFMNNVGALALVMPIAMEMCERSGRSPSLVLMPIAFGSILGGMMTLIGTPPNLVIADYRSAEGGEPFAMFDFLPVGLAIAAAGLAYLVTIGPRLLPSGRGAESTARQRFEIGGYITELQVPHGSPLIGMQISELTDPERRDLEVLGLIRSEVPLYSSLSFLPLRPGDVLIVRADSRVFQELVSDGGLELVSNKEVERHLQSRDVGLAEVVVPVGSRIEGRTPGSLRLHTRMGINILAIARKGRPFRERLDDVAIRAGDVLLLQGDTAKMAETVQTYGCLPLAERGLRTPRRSRPALPLLLFAAAIALTATHVLPVHVAFGLAIVALVGTNGITIRQLYETINWSVIVLLGAMIPLGIALDTTGATTAIAEGILAIAGDLGTVAVMALLLILTVACTNVINNAATAVVMAPLGARLADGLGVGSDAFLMTVAVGASCAFVTPIGHQNNVLVMGPGGYRFGDYWRLGLPLTALVLVIAVPLIAIVWT